MAILRRVILKGFKSIKDMDLELRPLNVLIGANGAGKSNLVSFFKMLNEMMAGRLQQFIAGAGRAQSVLFYGPKQTPQMEATLEFEDEHGVASYYQRMFHTAGDTLAFSDEWVELTSHKGQGRSIRLGTGHLETQIGAGKYAVDATARALAEFVAGCRVYHFHDTSPTSRVRQYGYIGDKRQLLTDGGNLAAFLLRIRDENNGSVYERIVSTIRLIAPFFDDFDLRPSGQSDADRKDLCLNWGDKSSDQIFGPHQLSDGTLRAMCLIALLMQPDDELPSLIIVDEPELGLHPYALSVVASLFKKASHHTQVLVSTQSTTFLDHFDAEDVIVVNREGKESQFVRPDAGSLRSWLDEYSLGEVWEKNVIGGGPH